LGISKWVCRNLRIILGIHPLHSLICYWVRIYPLKSIAIEYYNDMDQKVLPHHTQYFKTKVFQSVSVAILQY